MFIVIILYRCAYQQLSGLLLGWRYCESRQSSGGRALNYILYIIIARINGTLAGTFRSWRERGAVGMFTAVIKEGCYQYTVSSGILCN